MNVSSSSFSSRVRLGQHQMDKPVIPKDEGLGVMISAFVSREFGFGMNLLMSNCKK
jgi:hypothetical protein